ncbi:MAG: Type restriction-modification system, DNA-methyltransferase subunit [Labilithrix sp.]|nr:Type restriction-modification system, DNA-methyltransferase subunit [Labilithrix sp.]
MPRRHRPGATATSVVAHIEEVVVATSGEDAFELVFAVAAARVIAKKQATSGAIAKVALSHPELSIAMPRDANEALVARIDGLLESALAAGDDRLQALDAVFESLVPRIAKGDKGQFFTPRYVVDFVVKALAPRARDVVVDPACGSGAFLAHARAAAKVKTFGSDVDPRAIRVARLVAISQGRDPATIVRADGLRGAELPVADVVATNPPFAGRADATGFEVARFVKTPERDVLFLERAIDLLRPGGRLGIVLPYNKAAGTSFAGMRRWLLGRARVLAVVGLPRETFMPHTSQRCFVLFAKRRARGDVLSSEERAMFAISERAGKEHDLDDVLAKLGPFLAAEGFGA